mmetsp:Transcript_45448/g.119390  ORF Transcript_45448/g.119390 Transcript_45448/m.119390 type:complete len:208 (-) Transcript_45448:437-1060(-)
MLHVAVCLSMSSSLPPLAHLVACGHPTICTRHHCHSPFRLWPRIASRRLHVRNPNARVITRYTRAHRHVATRPGRPACVPRALHVSLSRLLSLDAVAPAHATCDMDVSQHTYAVRRYLHPDHYSQPLAPSHACAILMCVSKAAHACHPPPVWTTPRGVGRLTPSSRPRSRNRVQQSVRAAASISLPWTRHSIRRRPLHRSRPWHRLE